MLHKRFIVAVVAALLLATLVTPVLAVSPAIGKVNPVQPTTWSVPSNGFFIFPPSLVQPNGECEGGGNGSC